MKINKLTGLLLGLGVACSPAYADEDTGGPEYYSRLFTQAYGGGFALEGASPFNEFNALGLPSDLLAFDVRLDLEARWETLELLLKPRYIGRRSRIETPQAEQTHYYATETDLYLNEWLARTNLKDELFISYGRENLQWGPSFLASPSNPFNPRNGQNNPLVEQPGLDYARLVWVPSAAWTASLIANTDEGRLNIDEDEFAETYALKFDYNNQKGYASLIPSVLNDEEDTITLGYYGSYSINDAASIYLEGAASEADDANRNLLGLSYTSLEGDILAVEYLNLEGGCTLEPYALCQEPQADGSLPRFSLTELSRENYLLVQGYKAWNFRETELTVRLIHNLDDQSNRFIAYAEHDLDDHFVLYALGNLTSGGADSEFGAVAKSSLLVGFSYTL